MDVAKAYFRLCPEYRRKKEFRQLRVKHFALLKQLLTKQVKILEVKTDFEFHFE